MRRFNTLEQIVAAAFDGVRPPTRMSVTEAAVAYHIIRQPGSHTGPWSADRTPYMVEPQDLLTSLDYQVVVFAGPARTGKSVLLTNWFAHSLKVDPADMMLVHMAQHTAREWVKSDFEKSLRNSPELAALIAPGKNNDNLYDKRFMSGMRLTVTWPTVRNLSGKTVPRQWLMDYDRMPDDVDGEGSPFALTRKRGQTFGRFAMTAVESSPGRDIGDPNWVARTPHEAPPTTGILALYNSGDRRRWHWACPQCENAFEPDFSTLAWPETEDISEAAAGVYMICPHCGGVIEPSQKDELNMAGRWVRDGEVWIPSRDVIEPLPDRRVPVTTTASFWLKGPAAGFQTWRGMVETYLQAKRAFEETGDETKLRATTNVDQGLPYLPAALISDRKPEELKLRAEDWGSTPACPTVPEGVRFLVATIDVQARSFVVQVHGFTPVGDIFVIDCFKIRKSARLDSDGHPLPCEPPIYQEDWDLLVDQVMLKTYPLHGEPGARMGIWLTGCDSGGRAGSTDRAYTLWRKLKATPEGYHRRFALIKGDGLKDAPRAIVSWPDSQGSSNRAAARGDIPVVRLNANMLKDQTANMLGRRTGEDAQPGGMIRYSKMPDWFYAQLTAEVRDPKKGTWTNPGHRRNEAWDLLVYAIGLAVRPADAVAPLRTIGAERLNWANPPAWAAPWDENDQVVWSTGEEKSAGPQTPPSFAALGAALS